MAKLVKDPSRQISCFLSRRAFDSDAKKELSRIKRYGHRASFMLIQLHISQNIIMGYDTFLYQQIKKQLRACDSVYFFDTGLFSAILPDTHEGGGECAALRLKRNISQITKPSGEKIASSIGLVSVGPENTQDLYRLLVALERDLKRDNTCQALPRKKRIIGNEKTNSLVLIPKNIEEIELITEILEPFCRIIQIDHEAGTDFESVCREATYCVLVLSPETGQKQIINLQNIQKNSRLKNVFKVFLGEHDAISGECDLCLPGEFGPRFLSYSILSALANLKSGTQGKAAKKYRDALSGVGSATHQLNQPLQIIIGKIELMLLDLDSGKLEPGEIKKILAEIRKQVLYAADINHKINRLTKI